MAIAMVSANPRWAGWIVTGTSADVSGCEQILAAPGVGKSIVVNYLLVNVSAAISISIGEGEGVPGTLDSVFIGPLPFANPETKEWHFGNGGLLLTSNTLFGIDASGAGAIVIFSWGKIISV